MCHREGDMRLGESVAQKKHAELRAPQCLKQPDVIKSAPRTTPGERGDGIALPPKDLRNVLRRLAKELAFADNHSRLPFGDPSGRAVCSLQRSAEVADRLAVTDTVAIERFGAKRHRIFRKLEPMVPEHSLVDE